MVKLHKRKETITLNSYSKLIMKRLTNIELLLNLYRKDYCIWAITILATIMETITMEIITITMEITTITIIITRTAAQ